MINKDSTLYDVVGIGNAIVDVLAKVGDGFLRERSLPKGGMTLVEAADARQNLCRPHSRTRGFRRFGGQYRFRPRLAGLRLRFHRQSP